MDEILIWVQHEGLNDVLGLNIIFNQDQLLSQKIRLHFQS